MHVQTEWSASDHHIYRVDDDLIDEDDEDDEDVSLDDHEMEYEVT